MYVPGELHNRLSGRTSPLPFGSESGRILKPRSENSEKPAYAVSSLGIAFLVHGHTKLHAAREVHTQHFQSVQIGLDLLREQSVVGSVSRWGCPACSRPGR